MLNFERPFKQATFVLGLHGVDLFYFLKLESIFLKYLVELLCLVKSYHQSLFSFLLKYNKEYLILDIQK